MSILDQRSVDIIGLDSYAFKVKKEDVLSDTSFSQNNQDYFAYFRKHHTLNNYMINLYYQKGGVDGIKNCDFNVRLTKDDLQKLKYVILHNQLPEGYDLMRKKDSVVNDLKFIKEASRVIADGFEVYYHADW